MKNHVDTRYIITTILSSLILSSCVSTSVTKLNTKYKYRPTSPQQVELYLEPEDVPCDFERIALINTETAFEMDNTSSINAAKKETAAVGGNAIIIREYKYPEDGDETSKVGTMVAIYISDRGCS
ncbi:hypothetical protein [Fodinibius salsisoli]|uniref:Lipoprotein n=1 Tax=Fodinibius salsisoli TaxID=2820877 RepID=A0ABT3PQZ5_9BACT|nr:hypothetical protein [Fodinibius salsisoli]MCW9708275.1 hypothetical protein [Fodinibius salsisoli]